MSRSKRPGRAAVVGADLELGSASRVSGVPEFLFPMAFGAMGDLGLVEPFALVSAREARAVGNRWAFARFYETGLGPSAGVGLAAMQRAQGPPQTPGGQKRGWMQSAKLPYLSREGKIFLLASLFIGSLWRKRPGVKQSDQTRTARRRRVCR